MGCTSLNWQVGWGIIANHGGGYSYRLCKEGEDLTEECFQVSGFSKIAIIIYYENLLMS